MRLRKKRWAQPELEKDPKVIVNPMALKGAWREHFANSHPVHLELGCGRGRFIAEMAQNNPEINYVAVDLYPELLVYVLRKANGAGLGNIRIVPMNIERIADIFAPGEVEKIYINFCNPWPSNRHHRRRLTHPNFLESYQRFLKPGGEIGFKTDDDMLFAASLTYFEKAGFEELYRTEDLHHSDYQHNIMTEYEEKFSIQGVRIKFALFRFPRGRSEQAG